MNNSLNLALKKTSRKLSIDLKTVEAVYKSYWRFIRHSIESSKLHELSEEEFNAARKNINIPYMGKLYTEYDKVIKYKNQLKYYQDVRDKESKTHRLSSLSD